MTTGELRTKAAGEIGSRADIFFESADLGGGWVSWNLKDGSRFNGFIEPLQVRRETPTTDGRPVARVRMLAEHRHSNLSNHVHGAVTLALMDISLFAACNQFGLMGMGPAVTLDLTAQFTGGGRVGEPLDALVELLRETRRLVFLRGLIVQGADDAHMVASFTGTIRKPGVKPPAA